MDETLATIEAEFLKALANPTRLKILKFLQHSEKCVCEFTEDMGIEQSNISQHLAVLRKQGLVSCRKEGMKVIYKVNYPEVFDILGLVEQITISRIDQLYSLLKKK